MACVPKNLTFLFDFQQNVLDNARANALPPSTNNPVISQFLNSPISLNQQWIFHPATSLSTFIIGNGVSGGNAALLSYPAATEKQLSSFSQAATQLTSSEAVIFEVNCTSTNTGFIIDSVFNLALTSWATQTGETTTPIQFLFWERMLVVPEVHEITDLAILLLSITINQGCNERDFSDLKIKKTCLRFGFKKMENEGKRRNEKEDWSFRDRPFSGMYFATQPRRVDCWQLNQKDVDAGNH
ncbi:hypothetical protein B0H13DRAFT_1877244 [Mycena leptocephala]|nr:hypothetical protein B0H13DRAFT_1877244 [Mycena leptocephala]